MKRSIDEVAGLNTANQHRTLAEFVFEKLRADIVSGLLPPDYPLKSDELRQRYGIGISPLREALTKLATSRLVVAIGQRGFRVAPVSAAEVRDIFDARILVEGEALRRSVQRGDLEWEGRLMSAFHRLGRTPVPRPATGIHDGWAGAHNDFHRALLSACDSPWLLSTAETLFDQAERYRRIRASKTPKSTLLRDVTAEHTELLEAALAHDAERAHKALVEHYLRTVQAALDNIAGAAGPKPGGPAAARKGIEARA